MVVPIGCLRAVFSAITALGLSVVHTAVYAESAFVTKLYTVLEKTFLALLADKTAFLAVIVSAKALGVGAIAVIALLAVHIFNLPAGLAKAAAVAKTAHAIGAEPAIAAKLTLGGIVALLTAHTVIAVG